MGKGNIYMEMGAIIMEIGLKEKCKDKANYTILMEILNTKGNGKMIYIMEKEHFMD
jgi:hypothetical protein